MKVTAVVPAAGIGKRLGRSDKPFLKLRGIPIIVRTLKALEGLKEINRIILLVRKKDIKRTKCLLNRYGIKKVEGVLEGGKTRTESVYNGLMNVDEDTDLVLIHDGTRPFITQDIIRRSIREAERFSATCVAVPVKPTVKFLNSKNFIEYSPDRARIWEAQTPQVFRKDLIIKAYEKAMEKNLNATDDSMFVERLNKRVKIVPGSYRNIKITTLEDFRLAEVLLKNSNC